MCGMCLQPYQHELTGPRLKSKVNLQPYQYELTGPRLMSKVKYIRAWVVLGRVTTWEGQKL